MNVFKPQAIGTLLLASGSMLSGNASAKLIEGQTATMTFGTVANATYGWANEANTGSFTGGCLEKNCYLQNGIVAGVVKDPIDSEAHFHKAGISGPSVAAQYHPDSTGIYFRMADLSNFSLQSIDINSSNGQTGGQWVLYGFSNAINAGLLSNNGVYSDGVAGDNKFNPTDPEGGLINHVASFTYANDGSSKTFTLGDLGADWSNIGAFWLTFEGFNHSPTQSYPSIGYDEATDTVVNPYPSFDIRVDNVVLGAPVPVPGAVWLFGTGLIGLFARSKKS